MTEVNNVVEIRKALIADIKANVTPKIYFDDVPNDASYPYLVMELPDSDADGASTEIFTMYISGWNEGTDTLALENLMYQMNELINRKSYKVAGTKFTFRALLDDKRSPNEQDNRIQHREYRYSVRSMQRR